MRLLTNSASKRLRRERRGRWLRHGAVVTVLACILAYLAAVGLLYAQQRNLVFPADPRRVTAAEAGLRGIQNVEIVADDGQHLVGFYRPADPVHATVLYFFGQAGSLANRAARLRLLSADGTGVLMVAYRGYSGSGGTPSEDALHADADRVWRWLRDQGVPSDQIVLYGESLGTGVAVRLATRRPVAAVILDGAYDAITSVAADRYPLVPVSWLMLDTFRSIDWIGGVTAPLLMLHGDHDTIVPIQYARRLFHAAPEPKRLDVIPGGNHGENLERRIDEIRAFFGQTTGHRLPPCVHSPDKAPSGTWP